MPPLNLRRLVLSGWVVLTGFLSSPGRTAGGEDPASESENYYDGNKLNNLGRLGQAFEGFEKDKQKQQKSKETDSYTAQIRQELENSRKQQGERDNINGIGANSDSAIRIVQVEKGVLRVFLQAKFLFDENTATFATGAIDILKRVVGILKSNEGNRVELTLINDLDDMSNVRDVDAERALAVFAQIGLQQGAE